MALHGGIVLRHYGSNDAVPILEVVLQGHRVSGTRLPVDLPETDSVDAAGREEFLGRSDQGGSCRLRVSRQWAIS